MHVAIKKTDMNNNPQQKVGCTDIFVPLKRQMIESESWFQLTFPLF